MSSVISCLTEEGIRLGLTLKESVLLYNFQLCLQDNCDPALNSNGSIVFLSWYCIYRLSHLLLKTISFRGIILKQNVGFCGKIYLSRAKSHLTFTTGFFFHKVMCLLEGKIFWTFLDVHHKNLFIYYQRRGFYTTTSTLILFDILFILLFIFSQNCDLLDRNIQRGKNRIRFEAQTNCMKIHSFEQKSLCSIATASCWSFETDGFCGCRVMTIQLNMQTAITAKKL